MPEENSGILVDPMGTAEALTPGEHAILRLSLLIYRAKDDRGKAFDEVAGNLRFFFENDKDVNSEAELLHKLVVFFLQEHENQTDLDVSGLLTGNKKEHFFPLDAEEHWTLVHTLTAIRSGGWFAHWLMVQVANISKANLEEEKCPSPLFIAGTLTEAINEWNEQVKTAKKFAEMRPDLIVPEPFQAAYWGPTPKAATEPTTTSKPAKAPRTRKARRRKAA